eukprot:793594-Alexandrium_andersonii.AAC.1
MLATLSLTRKRRGVGLGGGPSAGGESRPPKPRRRACCRPWAERGQCTLVATRLLLCSGSG